MIKNYFMVAVRSLCRHKAYSIINTFGLAVGMACCLVIMLYVQDELAYDRFHEKKERIYRVVSDVRTPKGRVMKLATNGWPVGRLLKSEFLEVERVVYMRSDRRNGLGPSGDIDYVYLLSSIALLILLIACVNFINLTTARSTERAKEVGIRKVVGSDRSALIRQFLGESLLTALVALALALLLVDLLLPIFNELTGKAFTMNELATLRSTLLLLGLVGIVGVLAGLYPAFVLSGFHPMKTLKGTYVAGRQGVRLRQALVIFQFAVSCILMVGTLVVFRQLRYMQRQDLGFDKEQVLVLDARQTPGAIRARHYETIKQELKKHPAILEVSATNAVPGRSGWREQFALPEGWAQDQGLSLEYIPVDHDFVETMGLELVAGRDFSPAFETDFERAVLINEAAVKAIGWKTPDEAIGKRLSSPGSGKSEGVVVGVVKDYHHHGLQEKIGPILYGINPGAFGYFALRIEIQNLSSILSHTEAVWNKFFSGYSLRYFFLDEDYDQQYRAQQRLRKILGIFAILSIVIACLGLLGLAALTADQRTKEIGIRKVLGATVGNVVALLSMDFIKLVLLANLLAWPVAWYVMNKWLQNFAYRIDISWWVFALAGGLALVIALLTVSTQAIKAALANPVESLRYE